MGVLGVKEGFFKLMRRKVEGGGEILGMCFWAERGQQTTITLTCNQ